MVYTNGLKLAALLFLACSHLTGASWTPAAPISSYTYVNEFIFGAFNSSTQQMFAAWTEYSGIANYSIYTPNTGWSTPNIVDLHNEVVPSPYLTYIYSGPDTGKIFLTGEVNNFPSSYIYDPVTTTWNGPFPITSTGHLLKFFQVTTVYNSLTDTLFASWGINTLPSHEPTFSYYHAGAWTGVVDSIPTSMAYFTSFVLMAFDSASNTVYAAWIDDATGIPSYATYSGSTGPWSGPQTITGAGIASSNISIVYNTKLNAIVATWQDQATGYPYYSIFLNGNWSLPTYISPTPSPSLYASTVFSAYDSDTGQVFAAWLDESTYLIAYSILDPTSLIWSPIGSISSSSDPNSTLTLSYASGFNSMFAFWTPGYSSLNHPTFSLYFQQPFPKPISNLTGKLLINDFGTESELFTNLRWTPSPSTNVLGYHVYDNGYLIATLSPSADSYSAHNLPKGPNLLTVAAFNSFGESTPVSIFLKPAHL